MKSFEISENDSNQRLDKFLKKLLVNASISFIYKLNRKGNIKIDKKKKDNDYKLKIGDKIKIFLNDDDFEKLTTRLVEKNTETREKLKKNDIIFEDDFLLVINKNPGLNVHPGGYKTKENSLIEQVQDYLGNSFNSLTFKPSLIHRIDRDTSGIVLIGKQKQILSKLVDDFKSHEKVKKTYHALVLGKLSRKKGSIKKKLLRIEGAKDENKVQISNDGQSAVTHYIVLNEYFIETPKGKELISELEVNIETGRMHQIRVHLASLGNPILGDSKYGNKFFNSYLLKNLGLNRQMLHAWKIDFIHYGKDEKISLKAEIKSDAKKFLKKIAKI